MNTPLPSGSPKNNPYKVLIPITVLIGLVLLGAVGFLFYQNHNNQMALESKIADLEESDQIRMELEDSYNQAILELEDMRGINEELNSLIDEQEAELEEKKNEIARLIRRNQSATNGRREMEEFKLQISELVAEVATLKAENEALAEKNALLENDNQTLKTNLEQTTYEKNQLSEAKAMLVSEKESLTKKVSLASVINVKNVKVEGIKMRGDKPVTKKKAKTIDHLKVCFTTIVNEVTAPGTEKFYIRIVNPIGETMAVEELGSGKITNKKTGEEVPFTQVKEYNYGNDEAEVCFMWEPSMTFQRGTYQVEVYNKGHIAGNGTFSLK